MLQITRQLFIAFVAFVVILIIGTIGYVFIEGWGIFDSFYMTVITVTTVGYGEVHDLSRMGRMFSIFLILAGFGLAAFLASEGAKLLLDGDLKTVLWNRKMEKRISKLNKHYIVCGFGRMGRTVASQLAKRHIPVVVIESNEERVESIKDQDFALVTGDLLEDEVLIQAGIERAAGLITVLSRDSDNLLVALSARELNHNLHIVARGEHVSIDAKLKRAGADVVVSPYQISGEYIANNLFEKLAQIAYVDQDDNYNIAGYKLKTKIIGAEAGCKLSEITKGVGAVVALTTVDNQQIINPDIHRVVEAGEELILLNTHQRTEVVRKKVLVADDHQALRKLFVKKMRMLGYDVEEAYNGDEALKKIMSIKPDLVILDAMMPGIDGFEVCSRIKQDVETKHIKIVIFSSADLTVIATEGAKAGADAVLSKTVKSEELAKTVEDLLS